MSNQIFEVPKEISRAFSFSEALDLLKKGKYVARASWIQQGVYLWLLPATAIKIEWVKDTHLKTLCERNGGTIDALGSIRMLTSDGKVLTGYVPTQDDMLSENWVEVFPKLSEEPQNI